jgi:hypothetical protein
LQRALDYCVASYNTLRPHQALGMATPIERFSLAGPSAAPLTGALEEVREGEGDNRSEARSHPPGRRQRQDPTSPAPGIYAATGLARDSVTGRLIDDEVRIHYRGELRSYQRRHPKEKEEVI